MNLLDQVILLLTGLVAVYMIVRFVQEYKSTDPKPGHNVFYIISFAVLFVAGVLLIFFGYDILSRPCIAVVSTLIPFGLAVGLFKEFYKKAGNIYLILIVVGLIAISITRFAELPGKTFFYAFFHALAGLTIFFVPILVVNKKQAPSGFIWVTIGGALIGLGGIALAFLASGSQLLFLDDELVFTILAPILLAMSLAFTWGFMKKITKK